ncbi:MAG: hypothetical protein QW272_09715 [Candidatus Methanomethylicaceae archaeon]
MKERVLKIRYKNEETIKLWKEMLYEYKKFGKDAEFLLTDALKCLKSRRVFGAVY